MPAIPTQPQNPAVAPNVPPPQPVQANPAVTMTPDQVNARIAEMQQQVVAKSSNPTAPPVAPAPVQMAPPSMQGAPSQQQMTPPVNAAPVPQQQQSYTQTQEGQRAAQIAEVERLNTPIQQNNGQALVSPDGGNTWMTQDQARQRGLDPSKLMQGAQPGKPQEQRQGLPSADRVDLAQGFQEGVVPRIEGLVFDPSTGRYVDPHTRNAFAAFDPKLLSVLTPQQKAQIKAITDPKLSGAITTDESRAAISLLQAGITSASALPLPSAGSVTSGGARIAPDPVWSSLPTELQPIQAELDRMESYRLNPSEDPAVKQLQAMQDRLDAQRAARIGDIHATADAERDAQKEANAAALARVQVFMARQGITGSSVDLQYTADTIRQGEKALAAISNSERKAITEAQMAMDERDFELAGKKLEMSENRRKEYMTLSTQLFTLKQNYQDAMIQRQKARQEIAANDLEFAVKAGATFDDVPPEKRAEWAANFGVSEDGLKQYFKTTKAVKEMEQAKSRGEVSKLWNDVYKDATEMALKMSPDQEYTSMLPDGTQFTIKGMKPMGDDWESSTMTLGNSQYGPPGQYIISRDKKGNIMNAQRIGNAYVAPHFREDTGEYVQFNPSTMTEIPVLRTGQYQEGLAGLQQAHPYVQSLVSRGFEVTQEPGGGFSHEKLTGWDISMPVGTELTAPVTSAGLVKQVGNDPDGYGYFVDIQDVETGAVYRYGHMSKVNVEQGAWISPVDVFGLSGGKPGTEGAGKTTGPHVHFELRSADDKAILPNRQAPIENSIIDQYNAAHPGINLNPASFKDRSTAASWFDAQQKAKTPPKLSAAQVTELSGYDSTLGIIEEIKPLLKEVKTGPIEGNKLRLQALTGVDADPKAVALDARLSTMKAEYMKALSGAAVSESEVKRLSKLLPEITDPPVVLEAKLKELESYIRMRKGNAMKNTGRGGTMLTPDTLSQAQPGDMIVLDGKTMVWDGSVWNPE